jgi:diguanylate cyclase (GGDEF)-like protein
VLAYFVIVIIRAEAEHRGAAVVDELTGTLNRKALAARTIELEHQSRLIGEPVGLILGDLDHFKTINDVHGHAAGDAVLREVATRLRAELRGFDSLYRIGGEEFVILVPGAAEARSLCTGRATA